MSKIVDGRELIYPLARLHTDTTFTITTWVQDEDVDCNGAVTVIGDGLGTLIKRLQDAGIIRGTTAA